MQSSDDGAVRYFPMKVYIMHTYLNSALHRLQEADRLRVPYVRHLVWLGRSNRVEDQRKLFLEVLRQADQPKGATTKAGGVG